MIWYNKIVRRCNRSNILLPIKPESVDRIIKQTKLYEYRKSRCKKDIDKIVIYSTSPVKKVVAEVIVKEIITSAPLKLWESTKDYSDTTKDKFMEYFKNKNIAYAYKLGKVTVYDKPKTLEELEINYYPQSYVYLEK